MSRTRTVSRASRVVFVTSACFAAAGWFVWFRWRPIVPAVDRETATLAVEGEQLRGNEDPVRDALRRRRDALGQDAWTPDSLAELRLALGNQWQWQGDTTERATLVDSAPRCDRWLDYIAFIKSLGGTPGLIVESIEIRAEGAARNRRFTTVRLGLRFIVTDAPIGDAKRVAPSRDPLPVAPAGGPAVPRKIGPATTLRRPAAVAEPPASGPASASFRPDPSGSWAGINTKTMKPHDTFQ